MTVTTARIRAELARGAFTMEELRQRLGEKNTRRLAPLLWQMRYRTMEVVVSGARFSLAPPKVNAEPPDPDPEVGTRLAQAWKAKPNGLS